MGACYDKLGKQQDAIKCYLRADMNNDAEGVAKIKLAELYVKSGDLESAAAYYEAILQRHRDTSDGSLANNKRSASLPLLCLQQTSTPWAPSISVEHPLD